MTCARYNDWLRTRKGFEARVRELVRARQEHRLGAAGALLGQPPPPDIAGLGRTVAHHAFAHEIDTGAIFGGQAVSIVRTPPVQRFAPSRLPSAGLPQSLPVTDVTYNFGGGDVIRLIRAQIFTWPRRGTNTGQ